MRNPDSKIKMAGVEIRTASKNSRNNVKYNLLGNTNACELDVRQTNRQVLI